MTVAERSAALVLTAETKGVPVRAHGLTVGDFLATGPRLSEFWTPIVAIDGEALAHNATTISTWCRQQGIALMPHGKTTMAPQLWQRQLDEGALGITLATMGHVRTARNWGVANILLANSAIDARSLAWLAGELADPDFRFTCWADSLATIDAMERALHGVTLPRTIDVCVELGGAHGRTGARSFDDAVAIAQRVAESSVLRLAGVAGYEGALGHDRADATIATISSWLEQLLALHDALRELYTPGPVMVSAGGSAYPDLVADVFAPRTAAEPDVDWVIRSGASLTHDDGFYRGISPFDESASAGAPRLRSALLGFARVVSHPEPELALLDGGKRDFPFDEGLPIPRGVRSDLSSPERASGDLAITALNDQHAFARGAGATALAIGDVVRLGLSHPCTAFDKWRFIPVVESAESDLVVDLIATLF
ncbi:alanine racemase [Microbacterium sp. NC79]|uniref:alanine racemase n=1 Tax=Microbacterium sp. NC79 TaxID=2851009 RepID=UPI001C2C0CB5|nr:alanine racemase [Microbacterium sp. NC79]MBV0894587.1 alanine racemase [Microbacterium sp. NC79]